MRTFLLIAICFSTIINAVSAQNKPLKLGEQNGMDKLKTPDMTPIYGGKSTPETEKEKAKDTMNIIPKADYSKFSFGANYGASFYLGDVPADALYPAFGGYVKYSFSHILGLRAQYLHGKFSGKETDEYKNAWFTTRINTFNFQMIFNMGSVDFRKSFPRDNFYFGAGACFQFYDAKRDNPEEDTATMPIPYYLAASGSTFSIPVTFGYKRKITKNFDLGLEFNYQINTTDNLDLLDGYGASPDGNGYFVATIAYNLVTKNRPKHIDWYNPIDKIYRDLESSKKALEAMKLDDDKDGIPNSLDQEINTKEGYKVDSKGVTLDSDGDGIPDSEDKDPFGFSQALGQYFPEGNAGQNSDGGLLKINDSIPMTNFVTISQSGMGLPTLTFPPNHFTVHVEQYNVLQQIARILMIDTSASLVIIGHADNNKPNLTQFTLAEKRALEVKRKLYKVYEIPEQRMLVFSEKDPYVQKFQMASEGLDRKVEFRIIRPVVKRQPRVDQEDLRPIKSLDLKD